MEAGPAADAGYHQQAGQDGAPSPDVAAHHLAYEHQLVAEGQVQQAAAEQDYVAHDQQDYAAHAAAANGDLEFDPNEETGVMDQAGNPITVGQVDEAATKGDEWTHDEEITLLSLMTNEEYRKSTLGDAHNVFALIALSTRRTTRSVRNKFNELMRNAADIAAATGNLPLDEHTAVAMLQAQHGLPVVNQLGGGEALLGWDSATLQAYHTGALTAEQMVALQQSMAMQQPMTAEQLAAYSAALPMQYGFPVDASQFQLDANGQLLPEALTAQLTGLPMSLTVAPHQPLPQWTGPEKNRNFWKSEEQQELLRLVQDAAYRQQILGSSEISWESIAKHLGRGKRSVQRKYDNLKGTAAAAAAAAGATAALPSNDGKKWAPEEVAELMRLVEDPLYLKQTLGLDKPDWRAFGQHFNRSYESVSYKYSYVKNTGRTGAEGKQKHAKARHETSYKEMAIFALHKLEEITGVPEGTSGQICNQIAQNPAYLPQLDTAIVSGKKTLQRWKHGVRSALNAFKMFNKTGAIRDGEVVWRLDNDLVEKESVQAQERASRQRSKPLSGAQRRKLKRGSTSEGGVGGEDEEEEEEEGPVEEGGEESVHETLASMANLSQRAPSARLAAKRARRGGQDGDTTDEDDDYLDSEEEGAGGLRRKRKAPRAGGAAAPGGGMDLGLALAGGAEAQAALTADVLAQAMAGMGGEQLTPETLAALTAAGPLPVLPLMLPTGEGGEGGAGVGIEVAGQLPFLTMEQYQEYLGSLATATGAEGGVVPALDFAQLTGALLQQQHQDAMYGQVHAEPSGVAAVGEAAAESNHEHPPPAGVQPGARQAPEQPAVVTSVGLDGPGAVVGDEAQHALAGLAVQPHGALAVEQAAGHVPQGVMGLDGMPTAGGSMEEAEAAAAQMAASQAALMAAFGHPDGLTLSHLGFDPTHGIIGLDQHALVQPPLYVSAPMSAAAPQHPQ